GGIFSPPDISIQGNKEMMMKEEKKEDEGDVE
ncbi:unnamed protein product, partial [Allacma fusca]